MTIQVLCFVVARVNSMDQECERRHQEYPAHHTTPSFVNVSMGRAPYVLNPRRTKSNYFQCSPDQA